MGPMAVMPSDEVVAVCWLKTLSILPTSAISTTLPASSATWAASGYVTVLGVGGVAGVHVPMYSPVVSVDAWASTPNSNKPDWKKASGIIEQIVFATYEHGTPGLITTPNDYDNAYLHSVYPVTRPRKIPDDASGYAHISCDFLLNWNHARDVA